MINPKLQQYRVKTISGTLGARGQTVNFGNVPNIECVISVAVEVGGRSTTGYTVVTQITSNDQLEVLNWDSDLADKPAIVYYLES